MIIAFHFIVLCLHILRLEHNPITSSCLPMPCFLCLAGPDEKLWPTIGHKGRNFRILALDGHGASAIFVAQALARIEQMCPHYLDQV